MAHATPILSRGWNRPVKPLALVLIGALVLVIWLALTVLGTLYFYETWETHFVMRDQPASLRLPAGMQATAEVTSPIKTHVDLRPGVTLKIDQPVDVHIQDSVMARATLHTSLPVDTIVQVDTVVPVKTVLDLSVSIKSWLPRVPVTVPVTLTLPVRMAVPLRAQVPVTLDIEASGHLPKRMTVPVRGTFHLRPHVKGEIDVHMKSLTRFSLSEPLHLPDLRIVRADVRLPMSLAWMPRPVPSGDRGD